MNGGRFAVPLHPIKVWHMIVLKFGGTSMGTAQRIRDVSLLVQRKESCIVTLSAMAGVTDKLIACIKCFRNGDRIKGDEILQVIRSEFEHTAFELFHEQATLESMVAFFETTFSNISFHLHTGISDETANWTIVQGEMITSVIFTEYLLSIGIRAKLLNAPDFMRLNNLGEADLQAITELLMPNINPADHGLYITQGFVCRNHRGEIDNLKRGGSDYSATLIGAALKAKMIEIWTDIDGMQNNDPREVEETFAVRQLSFDEAAELAYFGAKILHPACVWPAQQFNIPIWLRNTMHPDNNGTLILEGGTRNDITAIAAKDRITAIRIKSGRMLNTYGFLVSLFKVFEDFQTPIDMITTSEVSVSLTIDNNTRLDEIVRELMKLGTVEIDRDQTIICVVGDFLIDKYGHVARILHSLQSIPIRMISYGGSQNNISLLVARQDKKQALNKLNSGLFQLSNLPEYAYS
jgi:aspartate kinase